MRRLTTDEFIERSVLLYGDEYDYSLVDYKNSHTKVSILCVYHGLFEMKPNNHLSKQGCPKCGKSNITNTKRDFISKANIVH